MRYLPRALWFDLLVGAVAALVAATTTGRVRGAAVFVLVLCVLWVPWDLVTERRRHS